MTAMRSSVAAMAAAAARSFSRVALASRAAPLMALIWRSQSRAAASTSSAGHGAAPAGPEASLGVILCAPHRPGIGGRRGGVGCGLVLVVGSLRRSMALLRDPGLGSGAGGQLAALVGE